MNKKFFFVLCLFAFCSTGLLFAASEVTTDAQAKVASIRYISAALAVGIACIAGGMAVGKIGAAAMGALSENPEVSGKAIPFVGLAEGICLWGFIVAFLIIFL
ncbi:ATP synthase subunit C [Treponema pedis]|uniref:ATP synthase subunit C n=1 Tax=Treponema pedis TaxID=409322 RepID=UPI00041150D6|nr:ATP synthase subunit C [Treponema pedis]